MYYQNKKIMTENQDFTILTVFTVSVLHFEYVMYGQVKMIVF